MSYLPTELAASEGVEPSWTRGQNPPHCRCANSQMMMVGDEGVEPSQRAPKARVLPGYTNPRNYDCAPLWTFTTLTPRTRVDGARAATTYVNVLHWCESNWREDGPSGAAKPRIHSPKVPSACRLSLNTSRPYEFARQKWSGESDSNRRLPASGAGEQSATLSPEIGVRRET